MSAIALVSILAYSEPHTVESVSQKLRIDFTNKPEWVEVNNVYGEPEKIVITLVGCQHKAVRVADFMQEGEASPELVSVFKDNLKSHPTLFLIVKWHYYLSGVETEDDYYEVHAYGMPDSLIEANSLHENNRLSKLFGEGFEGKKEGRWTHFRFKDAASVRRALFFEK